MNSSDRLGLKEYLLIENLLIACLLNECLLIVWLVEVLAECV